MLVPRIGTPLVNIPVHVKKPKGVGDVLPNGLRSTSRVSRMPARFQQCDLAITGVISREGMRLSIVSDHGALADVFSVATAEANDDKFSRLPGWLLYITFQKRSAVRPMIGPVWPIAFEAGGVVQRERGTHDTVDDGRELIA